jgi:hypothetical protein
LLDAGRARFGFSVLVCVCVLRAPVGAQLVPTTDEFQVNAYSTGSQHGPSIAADAAGNFVVAWIDADGDSDGIFGRRFDRAGSALGTEFQVNSSTTGTQYAPDLAVAPDGRFVIVWDSDDGSYLGVFGQRYDSAGTPLGSEFRANTTTADEQHHAAVDVDSAGNFVVVWTSGSFDGSYYGIVGRRFDSNGVPLGSEFIANTHTGNDQFDPDVTTTGTGFVVAWSNFAPLDGNGIGTFGQRFDTSGARVGTEFQVNSYTSGDQAEVRLAATPNDGFVAVWDSQDGQDGSGPGIFGRRFASDATPIGAEFQVNASATGFQILPRVAVDPAGSFVVTWQAGGVNDDDNGGVYARAFTSDGIADGGDFHLNQVTANVQNLPSIAAVRDRAFIAVWGSWQQDGDNGGIFGRLLAETGTPLRGRRLSIRTPPAEPSRNSVTFISTDPGLEMPNELLDDPRCPPVGSGSLASGARLRVVGDGGSFTIDLPCVNWSANGAGSRFRYRDASGATCRSIVLKAGRLLKASCKGPQVAYALSAAQGNVSVVLATGDPTANRKYCATYGPRTAATIVHDGAAGRRSGAVNAGPGACP